MQKLNRLPVLCLIALMALVLAGCRASGGSEDLCVGGCDDEVSGSSEPDPDPDPDPNPKKGLVRADDFTIALEMLNPEAWDITFAEMDVTVGVNDADGNPTALGSEVFFHTEGGTIDSSCFIGPLGRCTVTWQSGNPLPADGRAEVLAYTTGIESFRDGNANGVFDGAPETFTDLGEVFADYNENGTYDDLEPFVDSPGGITGEYDEPDLGYNGEGCTAECSDQETLIIGQSATVVMSGSHAVLIDQGNLPDLGQVMNFGTFEGILIGDVNGNAMPFGTTIHLVATNGIVASNPFFSVGQGHDPFDLSFVLAADGSSSGVGTLTILVETPSGQQTFFSWPVSD